MNDYYVFGATIFPVGFCTRKGKISLYRLKIDSLIFWIKLDWVQINAS